ncbi:ATPase synthesis protein 25 mitochondrial [Plenodomus lingam]|uniref:ATPase synthesis protein 25 n=1 Tax=Leptosphaeria maculans (strain JN3 / isolate v23.1.3 / race Av1-4-5-6-7-8) TaxID=985895 RepID=E4ZQZ6_LEPMJ|nr:hypothetical protein LEMA_P033350.1 [Plenodomus lingam JN3]KAH9874362.1 ATPase synthesis protein 25 mitochondrial [Plenodomus lingam]CBX93661.1 hypothetical protein LEMA_P033350.1 [Plenodomus lingam JN3]
MSLSLSRVASSRFICHACRRAAAQSAKPNALLAHGSINLSTTSSRLSRSGFSTIVAKWTDQQHDPPVDASHIASLDNQVKATTPNHGPKPLEPSQQTTSPTAVPQATSIPWYLRTQVSVPSPIQPAQIPDLPANPPPLLETLLKYISVTAGLDDLSLLDLRHLDPPPALGPKLIMIIGTARSEKHLHVAADRFCRFLRRDHGLEANAAGLLGRNELKIKLRRKAKRMRMLANVGGATPEGNIDDGIRTGWICCTLGKIEAHPEDSKMPGDDVSHFIGFRDVRPGVNIVVQMFTEEKRVETDLETLWGGVLRTHQRRGKTADEALRDLEQDLDDLEKEADESYEDLSPSSPSQRPTDVQKRSIPSSPRPSPATELNRPQPSPGHVFPSTSDSVSSNQLRKLHVKA